MNNLVYGVALKIPISKSNPRFFCASYHVLLISRNEFGLLFHTINGIESDFMFRMLFYKKNLWAGHYVYPA